MADRTRDTFDAGWLALREPVDHRSRSASLVEEAAAFGRVRGWTRGVDLGCGSGSSLRYLAPRLPELTEWVALDHDAALMNRLEAPAGRKLETVVGDLTEEGLSEVGRCDLITASALLDLVTAEWLDDLVRLCALRSRGALLALSYDGSVEWHDVDPVGDAVRRAVNLHQTGRKGMGRALGPSAAGVAAERFRDTGMAVRIESTPWRLSGPADAPLALSLLDGWTEVAIRVEPDRADAYRLWRDDRADRIHRNEWSLTVGHLDLLALPKT